ncbi:MAG: Gfo/Idh/MocA family oxidoreductase [Planctomycetes bacterium]|nr:Gfo/Idh/MocA family oxidoreductase [Planctomycetota bacterium]
MTVHNIGIILSGVTGRMGTNQHLVRSILAIREQGGVQCGDDIIMPDPILVGRNANKIETLAKKYNVERYTTDMDIALADDYNQIFFDSSGTTFRKGFVKKAIAAGKSIYCEKPTAVTTAEALELAVCAEKAGVKNGVVQDKLWLPGIRKFQMLKEQGFFGKILSVRGEFGYWVFTGDVHDQPAQRPSWNYRSEDGGGMIIDMHCHWRYVIDNLFGNVNAVMCHADTHIDKRVDEQGETYDCTADDSAYALFKTDDGIICQFNSSWCTRVRRDDLFTMHVDGTEGSAIIGLRKAWVQHHSSTPRPIWNPDIDNPIDFHDAWQEVPDSCEYDNAFKIQWELFLKHVVYDEPFRWSLREGAKGVQLAEESLKSHETRAWVELNNLS